MNLYLLSIEQSSEAKESSITGYMTYGDNVSGPMLPVYTSPQSLVDAMKACASSSQECDYIGFVPTDPFELSEMLEAFEARGLSALLFDPPPAPNENLWIIGDPVPVGEYLNAIEEIRPLFDTLDVEAKARFCQPSHLADAPYVRWPGATAEDIAADLCARIEELADCDDR